MSVHNPGARREELLGEVRRHRYRLHRLPGLTAELRAVTTELLKQEISKAARVPAASSTEDPDERPDPFEMVGQMTDRLTRVRQIEDALANAFKNRPSFGVTAGSDGERWVHLASGHSLFVDAGLEQPSAGLWDLAVDMERELSAAGLIQ